MSTTRRILTYLLAASLMWVARAVGSLSAVMRAQLARKLSAKSFSLHVGVPEDLAMGLHFGF
jgi:hypothetical protein